MKQVSCLRMTQTRERDLIRQFIQRPMQLSSLVTPLFSLQFVNLFIDLSTCG